MARTRTQTKENKTYFAWSNIRVPDPKNPGRMTEIKPGSEVTAGIVETEDEFNNLVEVGSVRTMSYPATRTDESPRGALLKDLNERQEALNIGYNSILQDMTTDEPEDEDEDEVDEVVEDDTATS